MSNKVKEVASIGSGLIRSSQKHFTPATRPGLLTKPIGGRPWIPNPNEPGCSRWFSSTPSYSTLTQRTFFSSNAYSHGSPSSGPSSRLPRRHTFDPPPALDESASASISTPHADRTPHLPLPPTLPYSPNSHPFRRHLEILSLALYSTPDESWSIYSALHPSLRSYIPDELFRNLLAHQVDHPEQARAWHRTKTLLKLAKKCDMNLSDLGLENIYKSLRAGMRRSRVEKDEKKLEETEKIVMKLWSTMEGIVPDLERVPHEVRRHWLGVQHRRLLRLQRRPPSNVADLRLKIEETTLDLIRRAGGSGLGHYIADVLSISRGRSLGGLRQSLRLLAGCMAQGIEIKSGHLLKLMRQMSSRWTKEGHDGLEMVREDISALLDEMRIEPLSTTAKELYRALDIASRRSRTRVEKALDLLESNDLNLGGAIGRGISVALSTPARQPGGVDQVPTLDAAIQVLEAALKHREGSYVPLVSAITIALYKARTSPQITAGVLRTDIDRLIIRFIRILHDAHVTSLLPSEAVVPLFRLILTAATSPSSPASRPLDAYILCRKIYQYARSASPPFQWSNFNLSLWRRLFKIALTAPNLHLHFASRLYTDLLADGISVRRTDALMMIRSIGLKPSPSRPILLERHIKDYLWTELDPHPSRQPNSLILAIVQGLIAAGHTKDAGLALALAERLAEERPLQPVVIRLIIAQLSKSSKKRDRIRCFQLLRRMSSSADLASSSPESHAQAVWNYNTVLSHLVTSARTNPETPQISILNQELHPASPPRGHTENLSYPETLSHAVSLYREMLRNGVRPNARTISTMLRSLLDNNYIDSSLAIFHASIEKGILLKSNAVGRLMVRLALNDRMDEADKVESAWRGISSRHGQGHGHDHSLRAWDKGVVGARVLVDIKRGKEVDLARVMERHGWKGSESFLSFLDTLRPPDTRSGQQPNPEAQSDRRQDRNAPLASATDTAVSIPRMHGSSDEDSSTAKESTGVNAGTDGRDVGISRSSSSSSPSPSRYGSDRVDMCSASTSGWNMMVSF
ncbi:hypothetical protein I316_01142 [Kwoniella heveanensis BCC8398]|uniref:Pentatricopeptide repeat domain-containing protein n=1 Tax=Kwoniella heveanensis BCC8398 TaxID=1296120 RepID=A0A1B9H1U3_9TREE|nr:hypothetical protein I316_01142 [Kwoniella heveanensis BCC8398]